MGGVELLVRSEDADRAREIIESAGSVQILDDSFDDTPDDGEPTDDDPATGGD